MKKRRLALHWQIIIGLLLGALVGGLVNRFWTPDTWSSLGVGDAKAFLAGKASEANSGAGVGAIAVRFLSGATQFAGDLFIRGLRFIAVPIVLFSLIVGVASLGDPRKLGRIGGKTLMWFIITTMLAAGIGLAFSNTVQPGGESFVSAAKREELAATQQALAAQRIAAGTQVKAETSVWQEVVNVVPANPFAALAGAQMLQVVFLSVVVGVGLTLLPRSKSEPVVKVCDGLRNAFIMLVRLLMATAPYAVFALIAKTVAGLGLDVLAALAVYCVVTIAALATALFGLYPAFIWLRTPPGNRVGFARFFRALAPAQLLAFSSSSSAATLPVTMECCRDRLGVSDQITSFVCPLGATINMGGTALYQSIAATFIAQLYGIPLGLADQVTIIMLATLIAVGSPGVPGGSIVMMVIVLEAIDVPAEGIAVILAVDRLLDMCRTVVNITGDAAVAAVIAGNEGQLLTAEQAAAQAPNTL